MFYMYILLFMAYAYFIIFNLFYILLKYKNNHKCLIILFYFSKNIEKLFFWKSEHIIYVYSGIFYRGDIIL